MSDLVGEAIVELRGDDRRLRSDIRKVGREGGKDFGKGFDDETRKSVKKSFRDSLLSAASRATGVLNIAGAVGPAILAIGSAASAAAAGVTAVAGALGPALVAGAAAGAGALAALAAGALGVKVAFSGLGKAIGGDKDALAALAPPARKFATTVADLKPRLESIRTTLQRGLFKSLGPDTSKLANVFFPRLRVAAKGLGEQLGNLADRGTRMVTSGPWRRDFTRVAAANTRNLGLFGRAGLQLADAFRSLFVTAQPLIHTFAQWALQAAKGVNATVQAARASGKLQSFWSRAATVGGQLASIIGNLVAGLFNIFKIGAGSAGNSMLTNLVGISRQFRAWTNSAPGIAKLQDFFETGRRNLAAMGKLLGATTTGLSKLGSGRQLAPLLDQIRTQLLPPILEFLRNANVSGALSSLVSALASLARVFASLSSNDSSLKAFSETLKLIGDAALFLVQHVPGASTALGLLFTAIGAGAALKLVGLGGVVRGMGAVFGILTTRVAVATGVIEANTGAVTLNAVAQRLSMTTAGTWVGVKGIEAAAWARSTAAYRAASTVLGTTTGKLGLAGIGIAGVAASANSGSKAMGALGGAASGAVTGAALGSLVPGVGTVVGGVIGGLGGMAFGALKAGNAVKDAGAKARGSMGSWQEYASTLNSVTSATTRATRQMVAQKALESGLLTTTRQLGIGDRLVTNAITSGGAARTQLIAQLNARDAAAKANVKSTTANYLALAKQASVEKDPGRRAALLQQSGALLKNMSSARAAQKAEAARTAAVRAQLGVVDKAVEKNRELDAATRNYSKRINSLPPKVITDIRQNGLQRTDSAIKTLVAKYNLARKDVVTLIRENGGKPTLEKVQAIINQGRALARLHPELRVSADVSGARSTLDAFVRSQSGRHITMTVTAHQNEARASGGPVNVGRTYLVGEEGPELVTFDRRAFVHDAATTARALATGGSQGNKTKKQAKTFGGQVIAALAAGIKAGAGKLVPALQKVNDNLAKLHLGKTARKQITELTTAYAAGADKLKTLQADIVAFRNDFTTQALGSVSLRGFDAKDVVDLFTADTGQEITFLKGLASLAKSGLNKTLIGQLQASGVAALPQVQAILAGGKTTISALNTQTGQLAAAAKAAGITVSETMFGNGVQMASSLIAGLKSQQGALVHQMQVLAQAMIRAIRGKKGLKMHSPSVPLVAVGRLAGQSVALGVGSQAGQVESQAARLAKAAIRGAGSGGPRPITTSDQAAGLGQLPNFHVHLPTGDPEAAALAVWDRLVAAGVGG